MTTTNPNLSKLFVSDTFADMIKNKLMKKMEAHQASNPQKELYIMAWGEGFTSAEDVIESLGECGIQHQVHRIFYEEPIKADDYAALEHYIKNEATVNCFNKDKEAEQLSESKNITLEDLLSHPEMERYLNSLLRNSVYYFPEEILLISFNAN
ncbi:MAG: hypothetical protein F6K50_26340 [Moorea sp. SIO3I7]|uniref:hypothetical protein n=1 Tax=unclassified Moorena TaxID=2683338 RepID=UPI0013CCFD02|nr:MULTISPECIES: hypothetical protein [unclassified Moorena]NEN98894.1 hypothetical protein [Moorena sp. SIO3I7]NEO20881.1 hypothetical protein [Moorena sp. SIO4A5]NEO49188.1 hypothetical protein [Moorena sp. SIO4A3]NEQ60569.1 hypothetical protein [Moorena sp. SIO4A1]